LLGKALGHSYLMQLSLSMSYSMGFAGLPLGPNLFSFACIIK
jgi:hypothetical protein